MSGRKLADRCAMQAEAAESAGDGLPFDVLQKECHGRAKVETGTTPGDLV